MLKRIFIFWLLAMPVFAITRSPFYETDGDIWMNWDQGDVDVFQYFGTVDSKTTHYLKWDQANSRFAFSHQLHMLGGMCIDGAFAVTGNVWLKDRVGIGTAVPEALLHVAGAGHFDGNLCIDGAAAVTGNMWFKDRVGIGTAVPSGTLDVAGNSIYLGDGAAGDPIMTFDSGNDAYIQWHEDEQDLEISGGNVGIGVAAPTSGLEVASAIDTTPDAAGVHLGMDGNLASMQLTGLGGAYIDFDLSPGDDYNYRIHNNIIDSDLVFRSVGTDNQLVLDTGGNVGIGTATPSALLHVAGAGHFDGNLCVDGAAAVTGNIWFKDLVGIGTATPSAPLHVQVSDVAATPDANSSVIVEENSHTFIEIITPKTSVGGILFSDSDASSRGYLRYYHNDDSFQIHTAGAAAIKIDSSQNVDITGDELGIGNNSADDPKITFDSGNDAYIQWHEDEQDLEISGGNVGIGTATPTSAASISAFIDISHATSAGIVLTDTNAGDWDIYNNSGVLYHYGNSAQRFTIDVAGNVGIGPDTTPDYALDINSAAAWSTAVVIENTSGSDYDATLGFALGATPSWTLGVDDSDADVWALSSGGVLGTNNVVRVATTGVDVTGTLAATTSVDTPVRFYEKMAVSTQALTFAIDPSAADFVEVSADCAGSAVSSITEPADERVIWIKNTGAIAFTIPDIGAAETINVTVEGASISVGAGDQVQFTYFVTSSAWSQSSSVIDN